MSHCLSIYRQQRITRRSGAEIGVAFLCHLALLSFYIYAHVYDGTIFKRNKGRGFVGWDTFGGRWKYLTYINFVRERSCFQNDFSVRSCF